METPNVLNFGSEGANGWGGNGFIPGLFGGLIGGALFGGGFGGWGNNGNASAAAALGAQATANNNTDLLMNALGNVNTQVASVNNVLGQIAVQNATNPLQVVNAIQSGDAALASQFAQCCCQNQLRTVEQTNTIVDVVNKQTIAMNDQFCALKERELQQTIDAQAGIIAQLRDAAQTATISAQIAPLQTTVNEILTKLNTTTTAGA